MTRRSGKSFKMYFAHTHLRYEDIMLYIYLLAKLLRNSNLFTVRSLQFILKIYLTNDTIKVSKDGIIMTMSNFNLRGIPPELMLQLKKEALRLNTSVNLLILSMIEKNLGYTYKRVTYHDLDHLAGTWSSNEEKQFKENIQPFEEVDDELWK